MTASGVAAARLHHQAAEGNGPVLFMLHGMLSSRLQWEPNLSALATVTTPVLFELWGHGDSPVPPDNAAYLPGAYLDEFERVRQELGAGRVVLCGQSFGAGLMLKYAIRYPERVQALVFTNSTSALATAPGAGSKELLHKLEIGGTAALQSLPMHPRFARRLEPDVRERLARVADRVDVQAVIKSIRITAPELSVAAHLHRVCCPVLLVNGAWESAFQPQRALAAATLQHCRVVDLQAGHAVNLEQPAAFNQAVVRFIRETSPPGARMPRA